MSRALVVLGFAQDSTPEMRQEQLNILIELAEAIVAEPCTPTKSLMTKEECHQIAAFMRAPSFQ